MPFGLFGCDIGKSRFENAKNLRITYGSSELDKSLVGRPSKTTHSAKPAPIGEKCRYGAALGNGLI